MPKSLSYPGWISQDTFYTMNNMQRFKIKNEKISRSFEIVEKSFFKFYRYEKTFWNHFVGPYDGFLHDGL